jgi:uncharacterized tellurite resistance protein B-like protein
MWANQRERLGEVLGTCYCMAAVDGEVAPEELEIIVERVASLVPDEGEAELRRLLEEAAAAVERHGVDRYLSTLHAVPEDGRRHLLGSVAATMLADGVVTGEEEVLFRRVAGALGFSDVEAEQVRQATTEERETRIQREGERVAEILGAAGWRPVGEPGLPAFAHESRGGARLRVEHNTGDRSLLLRVADASDCGTDLVIRYGQRLDAVLEAVRGSAEDLSNEDLPFFVAKLADLCPDLFVWHEGQLRRIT